MTRQIDTAGPGVEDYRSTRFTASVEGTLVYVYGYSAETFMLTDVWAQGETVECSWLKFGTDEDDVNVIIALASGSITSAEVYPKDAAFTAEVSGGLLYMTVSQNQRLRIEVNDDRANVMHVITQPLKAAVGTSTNYTTLGAEILTVDTGTNTITTTGPHGLTEGQRALIKSTGTRFSIDGTEINEHEPVYAISVTATTFQVAPSVEDPASDITAAGTGTLSVVAAEWTNSASTLYFGAGVHTIGRLFDLADDVTIYIDAGAVVIGSFDVSTEDGVTLTGPGHVWGSYATYDEAFRALPFVTKVTYAAVHGKGSKFVFDNAVSGLTFANLPYYLTFEGVSNWTNVSVFNFDHWESDGLKLSARSAVDPTCEIVDCFLYCADDGMQLFHNFDQRTISGSFVVCAANAAYHGGYFADVADNDNYSTTVTDCHGMHVGIADGDTVGSTTYPVRGRQALVACWVDASDANSAKGRFNYTITNFRGWGPLKGRAIVLRNGEYPFVIGSAQAAAGQIDDWTFTNFSTEATPGQVSLIEGRDADNTPTDIVMSSIVLGGVTVYSNNYTSFFDVNSFAEPGVTWDTAPVVVDPDPEPPTTPGGISPLWSAVLLRYPSADLIGLTNAGDASATTVNATVGQQAAQTVIDLWDAYAQVDYDGSNALHVEAACMGVIAVLWRRGGSSVQAEQVKWDDVFGPSGVLAMIRKTGPRGRIRPRSNITAASDPKWATRTSYPHGLLPSNWEDDD